MRQNGTCLLAAKPKNAKKSVKTIGMVIGSGG